MLTEILLNLNNERYEYSQRKSEMVQAGSETLGSEPDHLLRGPLSRMFWDARFITCPLERQGRDTERERNGRSDRGL